MKKISLMLALAGFGAATLMTACDSGADAPKPTKAQECANGLSTECLVGEWAVNGFASKEDGSMHEKYNYTAAPGKMIFNADGSFQFDPPATAPVRVTECKHVYGSWSVNGTTLSMKANVGNLCIETSSYNGSPKITVGATSVTMNLDKLFFMVNAPDDDEGALKTSQVESYSISAQ